MTAAQPYIGFGPDDENPAAARHFAKSLAAVRLAAKCFEIARTTVHAGERANAISRGIAVAEKAGLRLELFDIPGRDKLHLQNALRDAEETCRRRAEELRAKDGETIYDAKRRAFDVATGAAAERDRVAGRRTGPASDRDALRKADLLDRWPSWGAAVNALRARRVEVVPVYRSSTTTWYVPGRAAGEIDEWQLRELADEVCG